MDFLVVFLVLAASLWVTWTGVARIALLLFASAMVLTVALYFTMRRRRCPCHSSAFRSPP